MAKKSSRLSPGLRKRLRELSHMAKSSRLRPNPETRTKKIRKMFFVKSYGGYQYDYLETHTTYNRIWSGTRTPGFKTLPKRRLPVNNHSSYIVEVDDGGAVEWSSSPNDFAIWVGNYGWLESIDLPSDDHDLSGRNRAIARLATAAGRDSANLALTFLEHHQFQRMVATTIGRITGSVQQLRKRNLTGAVNALFTGKTPRFRKGGGVTAQNSVAQNWLELQYGWKPLLSDVVGGAERLSQMHLDDYTVKVASASSKTASTVENTPIMVWNKPGGVKSVQKQTKIKFAIRYRIDNPQLSFLAQTGFTNPLNLAWEVLPFSFVVDWFLPIGPYLESLTQFQGLTFLDGWETQFTRSKVTFDLNAVDSTGSYEHWKRGYYHRNMVKLNRTKITSMPTYALPKFKNPISPIHALNALALLQVTFGHRTSDFEGLKKRSYRL